MALAPTLCQSRTLYRESLSETWMGTAGMSDIWGMVAARVLMSRGLWTARRVGPLFSWNQGDV